MSPKDCMLTLNKCSLSTFSHVLVVVTDDDLMSSL
jgi:hypothetical protein